MADSPAERNPVEQLAEEFLERYRRGERPALTEYTQKYPEWADRIRDLFPALVLMEEVGPRKGDSARVRAVTAGDPALERLGDYRLLRQVGRGGMGIVYEAEQEALGRHVALKILPFQARADATSLARFRREARAAARLHHTNIVPVFDVGESQGFHYYAMQFIQGQGLDEVLFELQRLRTGPAPILPANQLTQMPRGKLTAQLANGLVSGQFANAAAGDEQGPVAENGACAAPDGTRTKEYLPPASATPPDSTAAARKSPSELSTQSHFHYYRSVARVGLQVAEALAYAHAQKILHRDIKPSNLLLDTQGTVWVTDFGLAKEEGDDLTRTGAVVGTLRYLAPERFEGVSHPQGDIYSLGLTLYELLTLRPAFEECDQGRLVWRVKHEEPPPVRKLDGRVPRDLETIVIKAIAKEPKQRYPTADEMAEDLRRFLEDRPIRARRSGVLERSWRWCRRNPSLAVLTAVMALFLLAGTIVATLAAVEFGQQEKKREALEQEREADQKRRRVQRIVHVTGLLRALGDIATAETEGDRELALWRWGIDSARASKDPAIADLLQTFGPRIEAIVRKPKPAPQTSPDHALQRQVLQLSRQLRNVMLTSQDAEGIAQLEVQRQTYYETVAWLTKKIVEAAATKASLPTIHAYRAEFWKLYWGEMGLVEGEEVQRAMIDFGDLLKDWEQQGSAIAKPALAEQLQRERQQLMTTLAGELTQPLPLASPSGDQ
jgi:serine/threonine protein kinase